MIFQFFSLLFLFSIGLSNLFGACSPLSIDRLSLVEKKLDKKFQKKSLGCCAAATPITQVDIGPDGLVIDKSGIYCLSENIVFNPSAENSVAITINADFVILDFSQHALTQSANSFNFFNNINAIVINPTRNHINIRNGTIAHFSNLGIFAPGFGTSEIQHQGILIDKMHVIDCGKITTAVIGRPGFDYRAGIAIDNTLDVLIRDCTTEDIRAVRSSGISTARSSNVFIKGCQSLDVFGDIEARGITTFLGQDILIQGCLADRNHALDSFTRGIITSAGINIIIDSCIASNNFLNKTKFTNLPSAQTFGIIALGTGFRAVISNCAAFSNSSSNPNGTAVTVGISNQVMDSSVIENCQSFQNSASSTNGGSIDVVICSGIRIFASNNCRVSNCKVADNQALSSIIETSIFGIESSSLNNFVIENCVAQANRATTFRAVGAGLSCISSNGIVMKNCHSIGNTFSTTNDNTDIPSGILFQNSRDIVIEDSVALNNVALAGSAQTRVGGITVFSSGSLGAVAIRRCTASGQSASSTVTRVTGIRVETSTSADDKVLVEDCVVLNNINTANAFQGVGLNVIGIQGGSFLQNIAKGNGRGIFAAPSVVDSTRCIFQGNEASSNSVSGFEDTNSTKNSAFFNNVAYNPDGTNFVAMPANTPIRTWTIGNVPSGSPSINDIDNLSIL